MKTLSALVKRNVRLFFCDKGMFFTSLITPVILLVLYTTFLGNVYTSSLKMQIPEGFTLSDDIIKGFAGVQLISSILSVSCVTVSFCANMLMVQDKANKTIRDLSVSPVRPSLMSIGYYLATFISTLIVCLSATVICLVYVGAVGWYFSVADVIFLVIDVILLCLFGVALSSVINFFLSSQGQISAVGSMVSSGYGFVCGAYMPLSQFSEGLRNVIMFLPGTYGTALVRNHSMRGIVEAMEEQGLPSGVIESIRKSFDCDIYFFDNKVPVAAMFAIIGATIAVLIGVYIMMNVIKGRKIREK